MPVTKSAKKALRRDQRRKEANFKIRAKIRKILNLVKKEPSLSSLAKAASVLDQAAKKGVIHKNKAARLKSRIARLVNQTTSSKKKPQKTKKKSSA
jgi:small subunit ribosomal protein S20